MNVTVETDANVAALGTPLVVSEAEPFVWKSASDGVQPVGRTFEISLGDEIQPKSPATIALDLSERPDIYTKFSDTVRPILRSNLDSPQSSDVVLPTWNAATHRLTASVDHFSAWDVALVTVPDFISDVVAGVTGLDQQQPNSPCPSDNRITFDDTTVTLTADSTVWIKSCLKRVDDRFGFDIESSSGQFFEVSAKSGSFRNTSIPSGEETLAIAVAKRFSLGLLTPYGSGYYELEPDTTWASVKITVNPIFRTSKIAWTGLGMLLPLTGDYRNFYDATQKLLCLGDTPAIIDDLTSSDVATWTAGFTRGATCGLGLATETTSIATKMLRHKVDTAISLLTDTPALLYDSAIGARSSLFTNDQYVTVEVHADRRNRSSSSAEARSDKQVYSYLVVRPTTRQIGSGGKRLDEAGTQFEIGKNADALQIYFNWDLKKAGSAKCSVQTVVTGAGYRDEHSVSGDYCSGDSSTSTVLSEITTPGTYAYQFTLTNLDTGQQHDATGQFTVAAGS